MDGSHFDTLARALSRFPSRSRRGALGLLIGSALSSLLPHGPLPGAAKNQNDKKTKRERERERERRERERERERERRKECKDAARQCRVRWFGVCNQVARPHERVACANAYERCCRFYEQCKHNAVLPCLRAVPEFGGCPVPTDTACPTGCCPADFPVCPSAGSAGQCCPGGAPIGCPNGSCTQAGFNCCTSNPGSCPEEIPCCGAGCCPPGFPICCPGGTSCCAMGTFCVGGGLCADETGLRVAAQALSVATAPSVRVAGQPVAAAP
jgi:hypothetical protein